MAQFFGCALIAVGLLITLLSGGCTLTMLVVALQAGPVQISPVVYILVVGLPFIAIGVGLVYGGRAAFEKGEEEEPSSRPESPGEGTTPPGDGGSPA